MDDGGSRFFVALHTTESAELEKFVDDIGSGKIKTERDFGNSRDWPAAIKIYMLRLLLERNRIVRLPVADDIDFLSTRLFVRGRVPHVPATFGYSPNGKENYGYECPFITCSCGWESAASRRWWEEMGEEYDEHLRLVAVDAKHGVEG